MFAKLPAIVVVVVNVEFSVTISIINVSSEIALAEQLSTCGPELEGEAELSEPQAEKTRAAAVEIKKAFLSI